MNKSDRQYDELTSYFKNLVLIIGSVVGLFFTFLTFTGIKTINSRNERIKEMNTEYRFQLDSLQKRFENIASRKADSIAKCVSSKYESKINDTIAYYLKEHQIETMINDQLRLYIEGDKIKEDIKKYIYENKFDEVIADYIKVHRDEILDYKVINKMIAESMPDIVSNPDNVKAIFDDFTKAFKLYLQIRNDLIKASSSDLESLIALGTVYSTKFREMIINDYRAEMTKVDASTFVIKRIMADHTGYSVDSIDIVVVENFLRKYRQKLTLYNQSILYKYINDQGKSTPYFNF